MRKVKCKICGRNRAHYAKGMCKSCWITNRRRINPLLRKKCRKSNREWHNRNKDYWRDYYRRKRNIPKNKWRK